MAILLTTPPTAEPIVLADVKAHLRLAITDDDTYITSLITAARRAIESRYGLCLMRQSWALFADAWPDSRIFNIPLWPVQSVDGLTSYADDDTPTVIDPTSYFLDVALRPYAGGFTFGPGFSTTSPRHQWLETGFHCRLWC